MANVHIDLEGFGKALVRRRKALGWSQYRLAKRAGLSNAYLGKLEQGAGKRPGIEVIASLAEALGVSPQDLFEDLGFAMQHTLPDELASLYSEMTQAERRVWLVMGQGLLALRGEYETIQRQEATSDEEPESPQTL